MAHHLLESTRIGPAIQTVSGVSVTEFVRKDVNAQVATSSPHGALNVSFMQPPPNQPPIPRVSAGMLRRKEPSPSHFLLAVGILARYGPRQRHREPVGLVAPRHCLC